MPTSTEHARSGQGRTWPLIALIAAAALALALVPWTSPASADGGVLYVSATDGDDVNPCTEADPCATIGHAIEVASGGDTIEVASGTYTEQITISKDLTVVGAGQASTFIQAAASTEDATGRVVDVPAGVIVTIDGVTIRNGRLPQVAMTDGDDGGAGIRNAGVLTLQNVTVSHNHALGLNDGDRVWAFGGGVFNTGTLTIRHSIVSDNAARSAPAGLEHRNAYGGGIYSTGTLTLEQSEVLNNEATGIPFQSPPLLRLVMYGGGIYSTGDLTIADSLFGANSTSASGIGDRSGHGGAIYSSGGSLSVTDARFEENRANNWGGAIFVTDAEEMVTVTDSMFTGNQGSPGGAIRATRSDLQVLRSTLSENKATGLGGAIYADGGSLEVRSSTFHQNEGSSGGAIDYRSQSDAEGVSLLVDQSTFTENKATSTLSGAGGAISAFRTSLRVTASSFTGNEGRVGGAVYLGGGPLDVGGSTFTDNSAREIGGAIHIEHSGTTPPMPGELTISGSTLSGNTAITEGSAIWFEADGSAEATHNWWGADVIPEGTIVGDVNAAPWCLAPDCGARIDVALAGPGEGTVTDATADTANCIEDVCTFTYALDDLDATTSAALIATPTVGDAVGWSGVCAPDGQVAGIGVALSDPGSVQCSAIFGAYNLTVALAGTGTGTVTSEPAGIDCGATCSAAFEPDTVVTLAAAPAVGSTFDGWSGDAGCGADPITVTSNMTCTASFTLDQHDLTVTVTGPGSVTSAPAGIDCPETCAATFDYGTDVDLTPAPNAGSVFLGWTGDAACGGTVTVTAPTTCEATFALPAASATLATTGGDASANIEAGGDIDLVLVVRNAEGDPATHFSGEHTVVLTGLVASSGGDALSAPGATWAAGDLTVDLDFVDGEATLSLTVFASGLRNIEATVSAAPADLVSGAFALTVGHGPGATLSVVQQPSDGVAGAPLATQPVLHVLDQYGNLVTTGDDSTAEVTATLAGGSLAGDTTVTAVDGIATFADLAVESAGAGRVLSFTISLQAGDRSDSSAVDITAGDIARFEVAVNDGDPVSAAAAFEVALRAFDAWDNLVDRDQDVELVFTTDGGTSPAEGWPPVLPSDVEYPFEVGELEVGGFTFYRAGESPRITVAVAGGGVSSASAPFQVLAGPVDPTRATLSTSAATRTPGEAATITVRLHDVVGNPLTAGGHAVLLDATHGTLSAVTDEGDGTYTATLEATMEGTADVTVTVNGTASQEPAVTVAFAHPPIAEAPAQDVIEETGEVLVPVTGRQSTALPTEAPAVVGTHAPDGARIQVTAPAAALDDDGPEGLRLEVAVATDLEQVASQAPPPADADVVSQFVVRLVDAQGKTHPATFTEPVTIEFTLPADQVPDDADLQALILVFWNGEAWIEVEATATAHEDGAVTLTAEVLHFTLFGVLWAPPNWGTFDPAPATTGVTLARWLGGGWTRLDAALGEGGTAWRFVEGRAFGYIAGAPAFVNRTFVEAYPDGVPPGTLALVRR